MYIKPHFKIAVFSAISFVYSTLFTDPLLLAESPLKTVAITQIVDHPSANAVREGVLAALKDKDMKREKRLLLFMKMLTVALSRRLRLRKSLWPSSLI
jgi:ABC-type uncharacterized transport system substrate-binding protein